MHFYAKLFFIKIQNKERSDFIKSSQAKYHLATHQVSYSHAKSIFIIHSATRKLAMQPQWKSWQSDISRRVIMMKSREGAESKVFNSAQL